MTDLHRVISPLDLMLRLAVVAPLLRRLPWGVREAPRRAPALCPPIHRTECRNVGSGSFAGRP